MNNVKKDLVMQDLVSPLPFGKRSNNNPIQSKENQMDVDSTPFEEVTRIPWIMSMEEEVISERAITIGYDGPTKRNVTPEEMLKDIKQNL